MKRNWVGTAVVLFMCTVSSWAGPFRDGPFIGVPFGDLVEKHTPVFGWFVGYEVKAPFSAEMVLSYQTDSLRDQFRHYELPDGRSLDMRLTGLAASARYTRELHERWAWYVKLGAGYYIPQAKRSKIHAHTRESAFVESVRTRMERTLGYHGGVGVQYEFVPRWELHLDVTYIWLETPARIYVRERVDRVWREHMHTDRVRYNHARMSLGVVYNF